MTPAARAEAAIQILDRILTGEPAEASLLRWSRASRYAGSGDRAAVRDLVFDSLRRRDSRAARGGALSGRGLILGLLREEGADPATIFTGEGHAPARLSAAELVAGRVPDAAEALDLPLWLQPVWRDSLGDQAEPLARAMQERAPVWLRANSLRATSQQAIAALAADGIAVQPCASLPSALRVQDGARRIAASAAYRDGLVELQDLSPQLACAALPDAGTVLDYCAGGGGKALALAARGSRVTAHDADPRRMSDLPARAARAGARIRLARSDELRAGFDMVVTDVPCSGSGTWRRTPDAKWRLQPNDLAQLLQVQARILRQAAGLVAAEGHLAYMTCSVLRAENGDQIRSFLAQGGFALIEEHRFTPLNASDGFYLALMRRC